MIEFYKKYFPSNYKPKVNQLILDIERLLELENIEISKGYEIVLEESFKEGLSEKKWEKINALYHTLYAKKEHISTTLNKFINKTKSNSEKKLTYIDTFAGCGGLSLGLKNAGFIPQLVNEIEPKFLESYYFNHDIHIDNYHCADIKELTQDKELHKKYRNIDLIVGGPPCQGFSMANRQRILDDPRNKLYKYFLELLNHIRPKFFVMENVKGMMKKSSEILDNFHSILGSDYSIDMVLLNAKDFGIPQHRERVFVVGSKLEDVKASVIIQDILKEKDELKSIKLTGKERQDFLNMLLSYFELHLGNFKKPKSLKVLNDVFH